MEVPINKAKRKPSKLEDMTKEQIRQAIIKKRECNAKAQTIVEILLEKGITEAFFLKCLPDINQSHLEDIIEERAITKNCGYPLCSKDISDKEIPKQKYRISMKTNKVYDITARKSFCSNHCYQAAMYIKNQMLTSPLWFREYDEMPQFNLFQASEPARMGQEVDVSLVERVKSPTHVQLFTSISDFTTASLNDITGESDIQIEESTQGNNIKENSNVEKDGTSDIHMEESTQGNGIKENRNVEKRGKNIQEASNEERSRIEENIDINEKNFKDLSIQDHTELPTEYQKPKEVEQSQKLKPHVKRQKTMNNSMNIVGEIKERPERKIDPILKETLTTPVTSKKVKTPKIGKKKQPMVTVLTIQVEKCLAEWFTIDTLLFLFGEEKVKEMVSDKGDAIKDYLNNYAKGIFYTSNSYDHYQALCKKLNMLEIEDRQFDVDALKKETKPLPDYSILQEESKKLQLKVRAFYSGETDIPQVESNQEKTAENNENLTQLPLIDKHAQNALRRRIVCQHLNTVLPDLLLSLGLVNLSISSDVNLIVKSFKLKANNITFKPIQWTLVAIVLIKLLSIKDRRLEYLLEQQTAYQHMQLLLLSYKQDGGYLHRLISWLTDIDRLLATNDIQLTVE